jgi:septum formation protein
MYELRPNVELVLASSSPRRRELLESVGLRCLVVPSHIDETLDPSLAPEAFAMSLASQKAAAVAAQPDFRKAWVLAADTIVVAANGDILGKPESTVDCMRILRLLAGTMHRVLTGVSLQQNNLASATQFVCSTEVHFRELSDAELLQYAQSEEPYDKAGAYGAQGAACAFIKTVNGSYTNVVGLPLSETLELLVKEQLIQVPSDPNRMGCDV